MKRMSAKIIKRHYWYTVAFNKKTGKGYTFEEWKRLERNTKWKQQLERDTKHAKEKSKENKLKQTTKNE